MNYFFVKRILDFCLGLGMLFVLSPLFIIIYYIIWLDSGSGVIFMQKRVGFKGAPFRMYKFRTMVKKAEELKSKYMYLNEARPPLFKIRNDPRLTRIGKFLRNSNLDELPQLFNVLRGDMSLVGPRPFICEEFERFESWQKERLKGRPGMTSIWHVSGNYVLPIELTDWINSDLEYIQKMNFFLDLRILAKTVAVVSSHLNDMILRGIK